MNAKSVLHDIISTRFAIRKEEEKKMKLEVDYTLDVNYEYLADCKISIDIRDLDEGSFSLRS